jgi:hypothetical protein
MASYLNEQYQRFYEILNAKDKYSLVCERCPLQKECEEATAKLTIEEAENQPTCEEVLFRWMLTGEKPKIKGE